MNTSGNSLPSPEDPPLAHRTVFDAAPEAMCLLVDGRIALANPAMRRILGRDTPELAGMTPERAFADAEEDRQRVVEYCRNLAAGGDAPASLETRVLARDGEPRDLLLTGSRADAGGRDGVVLVVRDITDLREADRQREESQRVLATLMANLPGMAYRCRNDPEWTMDFVSDGALALTGYRPWELMHGLRASYGDLIHPEDRPYVWWSVQKALEDRHSFLMEYRIRTAAGEEKWVWEQGQGVFSAEGELLSIEGFITDTTDRKRAEEEKAVLEDQLRQAQKMEAIGQLAGGVAHDFNNQLTVINGYCDMLLRSLGEDDPTRQMVEEVRRAGERAHRLTRQLLVFSRKQVLNPEWIDLDQVLEEMQNPLARMLGEQVELHLVVEPGRGKVRLDRGQLEQAVMNLAINARDAMPDGGVLTIRTDRVDLDGEIVRRRPGLSSGPHELLIVHDTGQGIAPGVVEKIFEPFFTTKQTGKGTGLGLAMVYGFVKQSAGAVEVESTPGEGATFRLYFPIGSDERPEQVEPKTNDSPTGSEVILVAEDEESVRAMVVRGLERYGYRVFEAPTASEALPLEAAHEGDLDLLVTDVIMPGLSGVELFRRLRERRPTLRVLFVSGYAPAGIADEGVLRPGENLLTKPFTAEELARAVRRILDAPPAQAPPV